MTNIATAKITDPVATTIINPGDLIHWEGDSIPVSFTHSEPSDPDSNGTYDTDRKELHSFARIWSPTLLPIPRDTQVEVYQDARFHLSGTNPTYVDAAILVEAEWKGWLGGFALANGLALCEISTQLIDTTDNVVVADEALHSKEGLFVAVEVSPTNFAFQDFGSGQVSIPVKLIRGRDYILRFKTFCRARFDSGLFALSFYSRDFLYQGGPQVDGHVKLSSITIQVSPDLNEVVERVDRNIVSILNQLSEMKNTGNDTNVKVIELLARTSYLIDKANHLDSKTDHLDEQLDALEKIVNNDLVPPLQKVDEKVSHIGQQLDQLEQTVDDKVVEPLRQANDKIFHLDDQLDRFEITVGDELVAPLKQTKEKVFHIDNQLNHVEETMDNDIVIPVHDVKDKVVHIDDQLDNFQREDLRSAIEAALLDNIGQVAYFQLPLSKGGHLEDVHDFVKETIDRVRELKGYVTFAEEKLAAGESLYATGAYLEAYKQYRAAYTCLSVTRP